MKLPNKKITNYVERELGGELLIYSLSTNQAICLNETSAVVFNACNGATTSDELRKQSGYSDELILFALDELQKHDLIENDYDSPFARMNRREVVKRVGLASMFALPMISAIVAPSAVRAASSTCTGTCYADGADYCAGRNGQTVSRVRYPSSDGSCTGTADYTLQPLSCGDGAVRGTSDRCITQIG